MPTKLLAIVGLFVSLIVSQTHADKESSAQPEQAAKKTESVREPARDVVELLVKAKDWQAAKAIQDELAAIGESAVHPISRQAKRHEDENVRLRCYVVLTEHFADEAKEIIAEKGLRDKSDRIRYHCAFHCGKAKSYGAHRSLRRLMEDPEQPTYVRNAATKSLAELGEPDVIGQLITMIAKDDYKSRHMGNIGIKALTGKSLNDFNEYDYGEGAFVSGGFERVLMNPYPPAVHDKLAKRHQALADFCRWLEKEKPELFKYIYAPL